MCSWAKSGFDRLREAGFSEEDIFTMRYQFHAARQREHLMSDPRNLDRLRQYEEEWMRTMDESNGIESLFYLL